MYIIFYYYIPSGVLCIFLLHVHIYIRASGSHINKIVIHNMVSEPQLGLDFLSSPSKILHVSPPKQQSSQPSRAAIPNEK
jgi:hypothetical protein